MARYLHTREEIIAAAQERMRIVPHEAHVQLEWVLGLLEASEDRTRDGHFVRAPEGVMESDEEFLKGFVG